MRRFVIVTLLTLFTGVLYAQMPSAAEPRLSMPRTEWLAPFNSVKVDANVNVVFKRVENDESLRITYNTKGDVTSKFRFEVDRKGTLIITEKLDTKRYTVTDVEVYYRTLTSVKVSHGKASFEGGVEAKIFDIAASGGAMVELNIKALDIAVECTGASMLTLSGSTKYITMRASTAKVDCSNLTSVSATVDASHSAEVRVMVTERLEAITSTSAKLLYRGTPTILRNYSTVFGGDILNIN